MRELSIRIVLIALFILAACAGVYANDTTYTVVGNTIKMEVVKTAKASTDIQTPLMLEINGVAYPVYYTANDKFYIIRVSNKTGNEYRQYLKGEQETFVRNLYKK